MQTYTKLVRFLKSSCPAGHPVTVRRLPLSDRIDGDCGFDGVQYRIRINRKLPEHEAMDVLLHEWAHAISWKKCTEDHHCNEWGKAYSRVYRVFLKDFLDR